MRYSSDIQLDIGSQVVGRKDVSRSSFDVWKEVRKCPLTINLIAPVSIELIVDAIFA